MIFHRSSFVLVLFALACDSCGERPDTVDGGRCVHRPDASGTCDARSRGARIFVSASDYTSGFLSSLGTRDRCVSTAIGPLSGDALLAWHGPLLVALNTDPMAGRNNVTYFDVRGSPPCLVRQISLQRDGESTGANPRGYLSVGPRKGYVARAGLDSIAIVDPEAGAITGIIDLAPFRGDGARAWPTALARVGPHAWVTLSRLPAGLLHPTARGAIAMIDPTTDRVVDRDPDVPGTQVIELSHPNPVGTLRTLGSRVLVACVGDYQRIDDGAIEAIDTVSLRADTLVTERQVQGNLDAVLPLDDDRLLLRVVSQADAGLAIEFSRLVEWSLSRHMVLRTWITAPGYSLTEPILGRDGRVYVGDRGQESTQRPHGIRVFDAATGNELTTVPIDVGLQPYYLTEEPPEM